MPNAKETSMLDNMQKKTNGIRAGAVNNTSDIPPEKIPSNARETVRMTKTRKSKQTTHSG
jgi:hypothetical protein